MTAEAALLGVPTFSCYPDKPYLVEKYLIEKELVIREANCARVRKKVLRTLRNIDRAKQLQKVKARKLTSSFEDPVEVIVKAIGKVA